MFFFSFAWHICITNSPLKIAQMLCSPYPALTHFSLFNAERPKLSSCTSIRSFYPTRKAPERRFACNLLRANFQQVGSKLLTGWKRASNLLPPTGSCNRCTAKLVFGRKRTSQRNHFESKTPNIQAQKINSIRLKRKIAHKK